MSTNLERLGRGLYIFEEMSRAIRFFSRRSTERQCNTPVLPSNKANKKRPVRMDIYIERVSTILAPSYRPCCLQDLDKLI